MGIGGRACGEGNVVSGEGNGGVMYRWGQGRRTMCAAGEEEEHGCWVCALVALLFGMELRVVLSTSALRVRCWKQCAAQLRFDV